MKTNDYLVSVIMPIYNVEEYLEEAIQSVTAQTIGFKDNVQLILVNDGSPDNSDLICKKYADLYPDNVVYIKQTNKGISIARNEGFKSACGKYILFLDSDDYYEENCIEVLSSRIEETQSDIALCRFRRFNAKTHQLGEPEGLDLEIIKGKDVFSRKDFPNDYMDITLPNVWSKMYRKDFLVNNGISFKQLKNAEDLPYTFLALSLAEKICYVEDALINYRIFVENQLSTHIVDPSVFIESELLLYDDLCKRGIYKEVERANINRAVSTCIYYLWRFKNNAVELSALKKLLVCDYMPLIGMLDHPKDYYYDYNKVEQLKSVNYEIQANIREKKREVRMREYQISVIMPIYNVEEYLEEAIQSVTTQTIGFNDNVQLILVNDGSPDTSDLICKKYADLYPDNVVYIEKPNGGVSSARNEGINSASGKYIVFLDGDDTWESDAFQRIYSFFEHNSNKFDVCSCKIEFSGDFTGRRHPLDYKFDDGNRIIDLLEQPEYVSSTIGNSVFRREAIGDLRFNEKISGGEDSEFVNSVLINRPVLGVLAKAVFYYRRNVKPGSGSSSAPNKKSWYLDIPREYYLGLCEKSIAKYGMVQPFIQYVVLYDMRWRHYNERMMHVLSEEEKDKHIQIMHQVLQNIDDEIIYEAKGYTQFFRLYFMNIKYGKQVIDEAEYKNGRFYYNEQSVLRMRIGGFIDIKVFDIEGDTLTIEGISRVDVIKRPYSLVVKNAKGKKYKVSLKRNKNEDVLGYVGETIAEAYNFRVKVPVKNNLKISFILNFDSKIVRLRPIFDAYIGLSIWDKKTYCIKNGYLIKYSKGVIAFYKDNPKTRYASELRLAKEHIQKGKYFSWQKSRIQKLRLERTFEKTKIQNRVAFISVRSDDELLGNMEKIYSNLNLPKVKYSKLNIYKDPKKALAAAKIIYSSKVVVTDDYMFLFKDYGKRPGQKFVQLWHSTGAGKHFGSDIDARFGSLDHQYHKDYDLVTVSGEAVRKVFASAFAIPIDRIAASGVARTDDFFDVNYIEEKTREIFSKNPNLEGKSIILYTPTFRDIPGLGRSVFKPALDFEKLSSSLKPNQVFVIRPHPVMTEPIINREYDNIIEIRDIPTNDLMFVSDMMITDYSSTMFEYSLLKKPMAFFCYDYDEYDRDFYIDFDNELPGPILKNQEELFEYLNEEDHPMLDNYQEFYDKYMGACDGHSTERIVSLIEKLFYEGEL